MHGWRQHSSRKGVGFLNHPASTIVTSEARARRSDQVPPSKDLYKRVYRCLDRSRTGQKTFQRNSTNSTDEHIQQHRTNSTGHDTEVRSSWQHPVQCGAYERHLTHAGESVDSKYFESLPLVRLKMAIPFRLCHA